MAYIWLGRLLMLLALPLLPLSVVAIAREAGSLLGWGLALASFLIYGVGTLISGAPFLALVHDSAPYEKRGQAVGIVQLMLVVSFAFIPAIYARLMPAYDSAAFARLVAIGMAGAALFWFVSVWREERPVVPAVRMAPELAPSFRRTFGAMWADPRARRYAVFLAAAALTENLAAVRPILVLFGLGFGIFTVGGVSLLMAVNVERQAGAYLALWSVIQLVARGAGIAMGGVVRDAALALSGRLSVAYAAVFAIEAAGLLVCIWLLARVDVPAFARQARVRTAEVLAAVE